MSNLDADVLYLLNDYDNKIRDGLIAHHSSSTSEILHITNKYFSCRVQIVSLSSLSTSFSPKKDKSIAILVVRYGGEFHENFFNDVISLKDKTGASLIIAAYEGQNAMATTSLEAFINAAASHEIETINLDPTKDEMNELLEFNEKYGVSRIEEILCVGFSGSVFKTTVGKSDTNARVEPILQSTSGTSPYDDIEDITMLMSTLSAKPRNFYEAAELLHFDQVCKQKGVIGKDNFKQLSRPQKASYSCVDDLPEVIEALEAMSTNDEKTTKNDKLVANLIENPPTDEEKELIWYIYGQAAQHFVSLSDDALPAATLVPYDHENVQKRTEGAESPEHVREKETELLSGPARSQGVCDISEERLDELLLIAEHGILKDADLAAVREAIFFFNNSQQAQRLKSLEQYIIRTGGNTNFLSSSQSKKRTFDGKRKLE